jgi:hypothetical protein
MIKKTFLLFIILFGAYTLLITLNPRSSASQHQWQENAIKGENYIYDKSDTLSNVIIGSSLACRIITDSLPDSYNLAFAGQSVFDGLEILKQKKKLPRTVFIETNKIFINPNKEFTSSLFSPFSFTLKKYCISLRSDKQPLAFIYPAVQGLFHKNSSETGMPGAEPKNNEVFNKMLAMQVEEFSIIPDSGYVIKQFALLSNYIDDIKGKGVNIVFFEIPLNPNLAELPLAKFIRNEFYRHFPANVNNYITMPDCSGYITTDGLHLNDSDAIKYTQYFKEEMKRYTR